MRKNPYAKPDIWTQKAKSQGFPARSVFKLEEIDRRCRLLKPGQHVLDLGCAPGSWLLYIAQKIGPSGCALGVDLTPLTIALPPNATSLVGDVFEREGDIASSIQSKAPYDVIVSDMAPFTSGNPFSDQTRSAELVLRSLDLAEQHLRKGGSWVSKLFMSQELVPIRARVRTLFGQERILRPETTRSISTEVFLVGLIKK